MLAITVDTAEVCSFAVCYNAKILAPRSGCPQGGENQHLDQVVPHDLALQVVPDW